MSRMTIRALSAASALAVTGALAAAIPAIADEQSVPGTRGATPLSGVTEAARPAFYEPPAEVSATPGTVIRQERADNILDPLGLSDLTYDSRRVMYSSLDREGRPITVTGIVISPRAAWVGTGRRPVIGYAAGTQGMADRCAPTRQVQKVSEYELLLMSGLLRRGYTIAMTDYQGLGTPGSHTFMNREVQGRALLDMVRATLKLGIKDTTPTSPVGLAGYSQGGGASAAAGELAPTYAPDLQLKGIAAGAVPADLAAVATKLDGGPNTGLELYAAAGVLAGFHIDPKGILNDAGMQTLRKVEETCVTEITPFSRLDTGTLTKDGAKLTEWMAREPLRSAVADNRIGNRKPTAPVLVTHSTLDDTIPYAVGTQLVKDWCAKGANVQLRPNIVPTHLGGVLPYMTESLVFFEKQFAGVPQTSGCPSR